jgi:hypothetical protein
MLWLDSQDFWAKQQQGQYQERLLSYLGYQVGGTAALSAFVAVVPSRADASSYSVCVLLMLQWLLCGMPSAACACRLACWCLLQAAAAPASKPACTSILQRHAGACSDCLRDLRRACKLGQCLTHIDAKASKTTSLLSVSMQPVCFSGGADPYRHQ